MIEGLLLLSILVCSTIGSIYLFFKWKYSYWRNLGIPYAEPKIPFGNIQGLSKKVHSAFQFQEYYEKFKRESDHGFGGVYFFLSPVIIPTDLSLLKCIFVKDFQHFHDRRFYYNEKDDPLSAHLSAINGNKWQTLRNKLSPTFTSGKMRMAFPILDEISSRLERVLSNAIKKDKKINIKPLMVRYTTDVISSCAMGVDAHALDDPHSEVVKIFSQRLSRNSFLVRLLTVTLPNLAKIMRIKTLPDSISDFFLKFTKDVVEFREKHNYHRNDFMDLLIQLKNTGCLLNETGAFEKIGKLTIEEIAAQTFVFFFGGYESEFSELK